MHSSTVTEETTSCVILTFLMVHARERQLTRAYRKCGALTANGAGIILVTVSSFA